MSKVLLSKLALIGCAGAALTLGACSSDGSLSAGRMLGASLAAGDGSGSSSGSSTGTSGGASGSAGAGLGGGATATTGGGTTTTTTGGGGTGGGAGGGSGGGGGGSGGGTGSINNGGMVDNTSGTGTLARLGDAVGDLTGAPLVLAGNALLSGTTGLGTLLTNTGGELLSDGLGGLPVVGDAVETVTRAADTGLNGAAKLTLVNQTVLGSGAANATQLAGVSALSNATTAGQAVTAGLLNGGAAPTQVASLNLAGAQLLGSASGGPALIGASVLSPTQAVGTAATVGVLSGATAPLAAVTPLVGSATGVVGGLVQGLTGGSGSLPVVPVVGGLVQTVTGGALPALPVVSGLGLVAGAGAAAGGTVSAGPVTASGGLLGGLGVALIGR